MESREAMERHLMILMSADYVPEKRWRQADFDGFVDKVYLDVRNGERFVQILKEAGI